MRQQYRLQAQEKRNKVLYEEHEIFTNYVCEQDRQRAETANHREKMMDLMERLEQYQQGTQPDQILVEELQVREQCNKMIHETIRFFESQGDNEMTFEQLKRKM